MGGKLKDSLHMQMVSAKKGGVACQVRRRPRVKATSARFRQPCETLSAVESPRVATERRAICAPAIYPTRVRPTCPTPRRPDGSSELNEMRFDWKTPMKSLN